MPYCWKSHVVAHLLYIGLDKESLFEYEIVIIFLPNNLNTHVFGAKKMSYRTYSLGAQKNCVFDTVLFSTNIIWFDSETRKN